MKAFSILELIFVIVIMGLLSVVGLQFIPDETLTADTQMLKQKILQIKSNAIGYKTTGENDYVCVTFDRDYLNSEDKNSDENVHYTYKSDIRVLQGLNGNRVCFDYLGRPYDGEINDNLSKILHTEVIISLQYKNKDKNITIYPFSGAIR